MKTFQYQINGQNLTIRIDEKNGSIADLQVNGAYPEIAEADMPAYAAAISLALIAYEVEVVHDDEPGIITLAPADNSWASLPALINNQPLF